MTIRVLYFVPELDALQSGVLRSQVLNQIEALKRHGFHTIFVGSTIDSADAGMLNQLASDVHLYRREHAPRGFYSSWAVANEIAESFIQKQIKADFIYIRSLTSFTAARRLQRATGAQLVYDCRGLLSHEHSMGRGLRRKIEQIVLQAIEVYAMRRANKVMAVSSFLADWIRQRTGQDVTVVPCCVTATDIVHNPTIREAIRNKFGIPLDAPVVIYSGGTSRWQRIDDIVDIVTQAQTLDDRIYAIYITPNPGAITEVLDTKHSYPDRTIVTRVPQQEVLDYLRSADLGILLRDQSIVNRCASPIKAAEYLAAGLTLAISPEIGDVSQVVIDNSVGIELNSTNETSAKQIANFFVANMSENSSLKSVSVAKENYIWDAYIDRYRSVFSSAQ